MRRGRAARLSRIVDFIDMREGPLKASTGDAAFVVIIGQMPDASLTRLIEAFPNATDIVHQTALAEQARRRNLEA